MFFFSHQTDRLNPFILTDFSCGTKKIGQDLLSRPFLIGNQNDVKYRSFDLLAAYAVVQPASAFGSSIKHRGMVRQIKIGRTINVRPQVYSVFIVTMCS